MDPSAKRTLLNKLYQRHKRLKLNEEAPEEGQNDNQQEESTSRAPFDVLQLEGQVLIPATSRAHLEVSLDEVPNLVPSTSRASLSSCNDIEYQYESEAETDESSGENIRVNQPYEAFVEHQHIEANNVETPLITQLSDWAINYNINHKAFSNLLQILRQNNVDVPNYARTVLKTPRNTGSLIQAVEPGSYFHFGLGQSIQNLINRSKINFSRHNIKICVNIDGLPLSKSSGSQLWPIQINLFENKTIVEICGLYQGNEKPNNSNQYMGKFVEEAIELITNGFVYNNIKYKVDIVAFICDIPAKAFIKCTRVHSGYMSCSKCDNEGAFKCNRICFPATEDFQLRTDVTFRSKEQDSHHTDTSVLKQIPGCTVSHCKPLLLNIQSLLIDLHAKVDRLESRPIVTEKSGAGNILLQSQIDFPIQSEENLIKFEEFLKSEHNFKSLVSFWLRMGEVNLYDFIKRCLREILSDKLAAQFSFVGRKGKKKFNNLLITRALIESAEKAEISKTTKETELAIGSWLWKAKDRSNKI